MQQISRRIKWSTRRLVEGGMSTGLKNTHTVRGFSDLYHVFARKQCILCPALRYRCLTLLYVTSTRDFFCPWNNRARLYKTAASQPRSSRGCSLAIKSCDAKRLQKRERQKKKKSKGLISKKKTTTSHVLHTFFFTFLCRCGCNVKLPSNTFYGENVVCAHKKHLLLVFLFAFFFTAAHFHLAGRWHFSPSL